MLSFRDPLLQYIFRWCLGKTEKPWTFRIVGLMTTGLPTRVGTKTWKQLFYFLLNMTYLLFFSFIKSCIWACLSSTRRSRPITSNLTLVPYIDGMRPTCHVYATQMPSMRTSMCLFKESADNFHESWGHLCALGSASPRFKTSNSLGLCSENFGCTTEVLLKMTRKQATGSHISDWSLSFIILSTDYFLYFCSYDDLFWRFVHSFQLTIERVLDFVATSSRRADPRWVIAQLIF